MGTIFSALLFVALLGTATLLAVVLEGKRTLGHAQLKYLAQKGDKRAKAVYALHGLGEQFVVGVGLLWAVSVVLFTVFLQNELGFLLTCFVGALIIFITTIILPQFVLPRFTMALTSISAPVLRKILGAIVVITKPLTRLLEAISKSGQKQGLFKEDIMQLFSDRATGSGDIGKNELQMITSMLEFGGKKIRDCMTPRRMAVVVSRDDEIGPVMMDELHKTGHSRFPVIAGPKQMVFVGTLYLRDLVGQKTIKKVKDIMSTDVRYIHEEETLDFALRAFLKTHHHLFVVVNSFEEFVGVLSIEDVIEEAIGSEIVDEFDQHDDLRAVAKSIAEKEKAAREKKK